MQPVLQCCSVLPGPSPARTNPAAGGLGPAKNALEVGHKKAESGSKKYEVLLVVNWVRPHLNISPEQVCHRSLAWPRVSRHLPGADCWSSSYLPVILLLIILSSLLSLFSRLPLLPLLLISCLSRLYKLFPVPTSQPGEFLLSNDSVSPPPPGWGCEPMGGPGPGVLTPGPMTIITPAGEGERGNTGAQLVGRACLTVLCKLSWTSYFLVY